MEYDRAEATLAKHQRLLSEADRTPWLSRERKPAVQLLNDHKPEVNAVLRRLGFWPTEGDNLGSHRMARNGMARAIDVVRGLREMAEVRDQLGRPALPMNLLHRRVYLAARPLWEKGQHRHAVADAATAVCELAQARLGRSDISDSDLMSQAFTEREPERGKPRLRCPGDQDSQTVRSTQQGALKFAMGVFQAIRNPAHHTTGEVNAVIAFEQLAALSIVARWIEDWQITRYFERIDLGEMNLSAVPLERRPDLPS